MGDNVKKSNETQEIVKQEDNNQGEEMRNSAAAEDVSEKERVFRVMSKSKLSGLINNSQVEENRKKDLIGKIDDVLFRAILCYYIEDFEGDTKAAFNDGNINIIYYRIVRMVGLSRRINEDNLKLLDIKEIIIELEKLINNPAEGVQVLTPPLLKFYDFLKAHEIVLENDGNEDV